MSDIPSTGMASVPAYRNADDLARQIAETIFPHNSDAMRQRFLRMLLAMFAEEIRRSAREP